MPLRRTKSHSRRLHDRFAGLRSDQLRIQCDLGPEHPGNRAILLGVPRQSSERVLIQIRYAGAQCQGGETDTEALLVLFEGDGGLGIELRRRVPRALQSKGQRHREAPCVRRGDQLFGVGSLLVLESGPERVRRVCKHARVGRKVAVSGTTAAAPDSPCFANHGKLSCIKCWCRATPGFPTPRRSGSRRHTPTYFARSVSVVPMASGLTPSSSIGALARLTQKVLRPNDLAPAASQPPKAAKTMLLRGSLKASSAIL